MNKLITPKMILTWNCCEEYTEEILQKLCRDKEGLTLLEVLDLKITTEDKLWVLLRTEIFSDKMLRLFAADCAENVLHLFEKTYPDDKRPRQAIEAARNFAQGKITRKELEAARLAALDAAASAVEAAVEAAAYAAAYAAAWSAGVAWAKAVAEVMEVVEAAAEAAAWAVDAMEAIERNWQVKRLRELILEMPEELI